MSTSSKTRKIRRKTSQKSIMTTFLSSKKILQLKTIDSLGLMISFWCSFSGNKNQFLIICVTK